MVVPVHARKPLASVLVVAGVGQGMIACGSLLARAFADLPSHQLDAVSFGTFYGALALGTGACVWGARTLRGTPSTAQPAVAATDRGLPGAQQPAGPDEEPSSALAAPVDPFIARLQDVIGSRPITVSSVTERDERGEPTKFVVQATKPGWFTNERVRSDIYTLLTQSIDGTWNMLPDPRNDLITFTIKAGFPSVITPPVPAEVPQSTADARRMYPDFRLRLGVTATGDELAIDLTKIPHLLVIGGTGSGKSVFARGMIESFRVAGWMLFLGDGKGTDYEGLHGQAGVVAISQSTPDHVRLARMVRDELIARQTDAKNLRRGRASDPFQRPPLLLLLDEYATMRAQIKDQYGAEEFEADLKYIARVGREFKVHLALSTQEAYRDTIPGQLLGNLNLRISLGPPEDKTIKEVFPEKLRSEAARIGGTISKNDRGRSLALITDDEGTNQAVEFQSYFSYSPAETKPAPTPEIAAAWEQYKSTASDRIPLLYPRLWFAVDGPDYGDDLDALYQLPVVVLTGRDGQPIPEMSKYDPLCDDYLGGVAGGGSVFHALDELPDVIEMPELAGGGDCDEQCDGGEAVPAADDGTRPAAVAPDTGADSGGNASVDGPAAALGMPAEPGPAPDPAAAPVEVSGGNDEASASAADAAVQAPADPAPRRQIPRRNVGV